MCGVCLRVQGPKENVGDLSLCEMESLLNPELLMSEPQDFPVFTPTGLGLQMRVSTPSFFTRVPGNRTQAAWGPQALSKRTCPLSHLPRAFFPPNHHLLEEGEWLVQPSWAVRESDENPSSCLCLKRSLPSARETLTYQEANLGYSSLSHNLISTDTNQYPHFTDEKIAFESKCLA